MGSPCCRFPCLAGTNAAPCRFRTTRRPKTTRRGFRQLVKLVGPVVVRQHHHPIQYDSVCIPPTPLPNADTPRNRIPPPVANACQIPQLATLGPPRAKWQPQVQSTRSKTSFHAEKLIQGAKQHRGHTAAAKTTAVPFSKHRLGHGFHGPYQSQ